MPAALIIIGAGGFSAEAVWVAEDMNHASTVANGKHLWDILGYADSDAKKHDQVLCGYRVLGTPEQVASQFTGKEIWYFVAINKNPVRERLAQQATQWGWRAATLIHPSVVVARNVEIGEGTYLGCGSIVCPNAKIGKHVLVNVHVSVGHDSVLGDFSQACPGSRISGNCFLDRLAFVGSNATLLPGVKVGVGATISANSMALRSVEPHVTLVGVPGRTFCSPPANESPT